MAKVCDICQKGYQKGNLVPRGIGRRVTKRSITARYPNLRAKRFAVNGGTVKLFVCTSCLKRLKFEEKLIKAEVAAKEAVKTGA